MRCSALYLCSCRWLQLVQLDVQNSDALQFTTLSSLTALHLADAPNVNDLAVTAMVCRLPQLQKLLVWGCRLESPTLWPVFSTATQLIHLEIGACAPVLTEESLQLLLPLQQLTYLFVGGQQGENISDEAWEAFMEAMPVLSSARYPSYYHRMLHKYFSVVWPVQGF